MLSDLHFDPFHDPAKFDRLQAAPVTEWAAVFDSSPSATQASSFASLQQTCGAKGVDTPIALLEDSLHAAHTRQPSPLFITISGDLMAHKFDCRFHTLAPKASASDLSAFAAKTIAFVALELHQTFPSVPAYFALGNNDSGCQDYREDASSPFLHAVAQSFADDVVNPANRAAILQQFPQLGDYSVSLPAPMHNARLIVLQDIFESKRYAGCSGQTSDASAEAQIAWLRAQLVAAQAAHEDVWVMAHIPPGIDAYTTITGLRDICGGQAPALFLNNTALADVLTEFPDTVRLALFAHTHMDELRLLRSDSGALVAAKLVPSISPVDGNNPAFTLGQVNASTAVLRDYTIYAASNQTGVGTTWSDEYTYSSTYRLPDFSAASLARLTSGFLADKDGSSAASRDYQRFYFVGLRGDSIAAKVAAMHLIWPVYACSLTQTHTAGFRACVCPASAPKSPAPQP
jgi:sphingomyelin phosphodiesterase acid-like 3